MTENYSSEETLVSPGLVLNELFGIEPTCLEAGIVECEAKIESEGSTYSANLIYGTNHDNDLTFLLNIDGVAVNTEGIGLEDVFIRGFDSESSNIYYSLSHEVINQFPEESFWSKNKKKILTTAVVGSAAIFFYANRSKIPIDRFIKNK